MLYKLSIMLLICNLINISSMEQTPKKNKKGFIPNSDSPKKNKRWKPEKSCIYEKNLLELIKDNNFEIFKVIILSAIKKDNHIINEHLFQSKVEQLLKERKIEEQLIFAEVYNKEGKRADIVCMEEENGKKNIFIIEIKYDSNVYEAMKQMKNNEYEKELKVDINLEANKILKLEEGLILRIGINFTKNCSMQMIVAEKQNNGKFEEIYSSIEEQEKSDKKLNEIINKNIHKRSNPFGKINDESPEFIIKKLFQDTTKKTPEK